jgi:hypothetical protein
MPQKYAPEFHPTKRAVIKGEINRRLRLCSTETSYNKAIEDLVSKLTNRKYPIKEIQDILKTYPSSKRRTILNKTVARIRKHRSS